jgi:hypothetical protein
MKKVIRNVGIVVAVIIAIGILMPISFVKTSDRGMTHDYFPEELKGRIKSETAGYSDEEIVKYSLDLSAEMLRFTRVNALKDGKANCVGYAQLCSNICNYAFAACHSKARTKPVVGTIMVCGIDVCKVAYSLAPAKDKNFVKDHDFVEYRHQDETTTFFDPSIYDVSFGLHGK